MMASTVLPNNNAGTFQAQPTITSFSMPQGSGSWHNTQSFSQSSGTTSPPFAQANQDSDPASSSIAGSSKQTHESERPRKRQKPDEGRMSYPRKRAVTACSVCRVRKSKCDNQRPVCGSCNESNAECVYRDQQSDMSSFDSASLAILDRLNYSIQLSEGHAQALARAEFLASLQPQSHPSVGITETTGMVFSASVQTSPDQNPPSHDLVIDNATTLGEAQAVSANCSSGKVLEWPIFEGKFDSDNSENLLFNPSASQENRKDPRRIDLSNLPASLIGRSGYGRGVREEDVQMLISDFLKHVHVKNPILDPSALKFMARQIPEHGFGWDESSCLILIACALANLAAPFAAVRPEKKDRSYLDARDYVTADAYYTAARKRIGLLENSVLATQCYFLTGVYEMYSLRPLQAWLSFNRACTTFQIYLRTQPLGTVYSKSSRRVEQRLYSSCLKSECELREEIDLPPTSLALVEYPDLFPSPPDDTPLPDEINQPAPSDPLESAFQQGWYYYLSEIALRRIANRIIHSLHRTDPQSWLAMRLKRMQRIAEELDAQVLQWLENLPHVLAFEAQTPSHELGFMLQARFLALREHIWRPFLYLAIHRKSTEAEHRIITTHAQKCLDCILKLIGLGAIKHRHHGTWFGARNLFTISLILLAAVKSQKITVPSEWRSSVDLAMAFMEYWESEAPDLNPARLTLVSLLEELDGFSGSS